MGLVRKSLSEIDARRRGEKATRKRKQSQGCPQAATMRKQATK